MDGAPRKVPMIGARLAPFRVESLKSSRIVTPSAVYRCAAVLVALASLSACTKDSTPDKRGGAARASTGPKIDDSAAGSIDLGGAPYSATTLAAVGSVSGTVRLSDSTVSDTIATDSTSGGPDCIAKPVRKGQAPKHVPLSAIVWIANVKAGKPIPIEKRADLASEDCLLDPRVQAVVVGTTINVVNDDKVLHKLVFTRLGTHDTLTVTPFFNVGQIVASERLAKKSGMVEVRCAQHPWTRAYIAVFDHPYFAVTESNGSFKIDSLPPGSYKMMVWREGAAKPVEQQIQIAAGGTAKVNIQ